MYTPCYQKLSILNDLLCKYDIYYTNHIFNMTLILTLYKTIASVSMFTQVKTETLYMPQFNINV